MADNPSANADDLDPQVAPEDRPKASGGSRKWLWLTLLLVLLLTGGGAAGWYFFMQPAAEADSASAEPSQAPAARPHYLQLEPGFVVNLADPELMRYLQVDMQLMSHDPSVLARVEEVMPEIRNRLLLLFSQQSYEGLLSRSGKEALQEKARSDINQVLTDYGSAETISAVYFTSFVMQ